jgi:hypothetical protein
MTIVLVHGVPETSSVWDLLADKLVELGHDEPLRLSPLGIRCTCSRRLGRDRQ